MRARGRPWSGIPPQAAAAARDTLGGALAAASQLPDQLGAALLDSARQAFTQGLQVTAASSVALAVGIATLAAALLRGVRPGSQPDQQPDPSQDDTGAARPGVEMQTLESSYQEDGDAA